MFKKIVIILVVGSTLPQRFYSMPRMDSFQSTIVVNFNQEIFELSPGCVSVGINRKTGTPYRNTQALQ